MEPKVHGPQGLMGEFLIKQGVQAVTAGIRSR